MLSCNRLSMIRNIGMHIALRYWDNLKKNHDNLFFENLFLYTIGNKMPGQVNRVKTYVLVRRVSVCDSWLVFDNHIIQDQYTSISLDLLFKHVGGHLHQLAKGEF